MAERRNVRVSLLVVATHFVLTSLIAYYVGYRVGGSAGQSIARLIIDVDESHGAMSEPTIVERYRDIANATQASAARWEPVSVLVSLPIKFALEPMFRPLSHSWSDRALANELSSAQWKMRIHALILFENLLNSAFLGFLVYCGLRIARRPNAP